MQKNAPLADRLRPKTLEEFIGQNQILAEGRLLRRAITADRVGNLLLHGPPGVGKTTLAKIIAGQTRSHFSNLNAVLTGVKEIRQEVAAAKERLEKYGQRTILFIDEVHRFNSIQQDALLPWVENGTIILIGATTENPYFEVNKALLSRATLFRLQALETKDLYCLLKRALKDCESGYGLKQIKISQDAKNHLVDIANGDARTLLNALELAVESTKPDSEGIIHINLSVAEESIQERAVLYDKQGDAHFDTISAFIKSLRGSDPDAAMFWLARMIEAGENPRFIFRRMLIAASEDIGLADPQAIVVVEACASAFERVGMPEGLYSLAQAALYLACSEKSNSVMGFFEALRTIKKTQKQNVPSHLRDANRDGEAFGDGIGYRYPHSFDKHWVLQQYLPHNLQGEIFWEPSINGWEGKRRTIMLERRAAQLGAISESKDEHPLLISNSPENPKLEQWLQRQLGQEDDRLLYLKEKIWSKVSWHRQDRVLLINCKSLLWAIDPLKKALEGSVTILSSNDEDQSKLKDQIELLDPLLRPTILPGGPKELKKLPKNHTFELIGGRLFGKDLSDRKIIDNWKSINEKCSAETNLRIIVSNPTLGPAKALIELIHKEDEILAAKNSLASLIIKEDNWLRSLSLENTFLEVLADLGWELKTEEWQESIPFPIGQTLEERLLGKEELYRKKIVKGVPQESINSLRKMLHKFKGEKLPQRVNHLLIIGNKQIKNK